MRRASLVVIFPLLSFTQSAIAEDSVVISGHYYKERSTRVYEPIFKLKKDLPAQVELDAELVVDQITSASGAFTPVDEVISEVRYEGSVAVRKKFGEMLMPGINMRASYEPDYTSIRGGLDLELSLNRETTTLRFFGQFQYDWVRETRPDNLATFLIGSSFTHAVTKAMLVGASLETRLLRGYQENIFRPETHPRRRNRYTGSAWAAYFIEPTNTGVRATYRAYGDTWDLLSHTFDFEASQDIYAGFAVIARFRYYTQNDVCFARNPQPADCFPNEGPYNTMDPKLMIFDSRMYSLALRIPLTFMAKSGVSSLASSRLEPVYTYLDQTNAYGPAHIAQLLWYWPF